MNATKPNVTLNEIFETYRSLAVAMEQGITQYTGQCIMHHLTSEDAASNVGIQFLTAEIMSARWPVMQSNDSMFGCWLRDRVSAIRNKLGHDARTTDNNEEYVNVATYRGFDYQDFNGLLSNLNVEDTDKCSLATFALLERELDPIAFEVALTDLPNDIRVAYLDLLTRVGFGAFGSVEFHDDIRRASMYDPRADFHALDLTHPYALLRAIRVSQFRQENTPTLTRETVAYHLRTVSEGEVTHALSANLRGGGVDVKISRSSTATAHYQMLTPACATVAAFALNNKTVLETLRDTCYAHADELERYAETVFERAVCFAQRYVAFLADFRSVYGSVDGHVYATMRGGKRIKVRTSGYQSFPVLLERFESLSAQVRELLTKAGHDGTSARHSCLVRPNSGLVNEGDVVFDLAVFSRNVMSLFWDLDRLCDEDGFDFNSYNTDRAYSYGFQTLVAKAANAIGFNKLKLCSGLMTIRRDRMPFAVPDARKLAYTLAVKMSIGALTTITQCLQYSYGPFTMASSSGSSAAAWKLIAAGLPASKLSYDIKINRRSRNQLLRDSAFDCCAIQEQNLINALLEYLDVGSLDADYEKNLVVVGPAVGEQAPVAPKPQDDDGFFDDDEIEEDDEDDEDEDDEEEPDFDPDEDEEDDEEEQDDED